MSGTFRKGIFIIGAIFLLLLSSIQIVLGNNIDPNEPQTINFQNNEYFNDCIILIFGTCNDVKGPLLWRLGLYCNFFKKDFTINANGEIDENINLMVRGGGSFKFLWGKEDINIHLNGATGILFWGVKSILLDTNHIIARCQVKHLNLYYP
jgi:hypothetical protein